MSVAEPTVFPTRYVYTCPSCSSDIEVPLTSGLLPASAKCAKCGTIISFPPSPQRTQQAQQTQANQWTPEQVESLIKLVETLASKYITYFDRKAVAEERTLRTVTKHSMILTLILASFLGVIVGLMSYLTLVGKVSGDALLFLVGTVTGYILLFIQRLTKSVLSGGNGDEDEGE